MVDHRRSRTADGKLRAFAFGGHGAEGSGPLHGPPVAIDLAPTVATTPILPGLELDDGAIATVTLLYARGARSWLTVVEGLPESARTPRKVRFVERSAETTKVLATFESYAFASRKMAYSRYERDGEAAVVPFAGSIYAVSRAGVLVLDGPGELRARFAERPDDSCPADKRCELRPAEISLPSLLGLAPDGASFVVANEGKIARFATTGATAASVVFGYHNLFLGGAVGTTTVTLAHAGEPPFVARWSAPKPATNAPPPPPGAPKASKQPAADAAPELGANTILARGRAYVALAETSDGATYAMTDDGALDRLDGEKATPVVAPTPLARVVALAPGPTLAYVVATDGARPVYGIVVAP